ncbi:hypothetical protein HAX54_034521 [Datura stramonium]|uniref:Uncharacterized protein n=1 Tax=Datura stramonium TaxID=4076 RepID=A0ABS8VHT9_DATST|nr:hypothetical protein [Datura stramonium]
MSITSVKGPTFKRTQNTKNRSCHKDPMLLFCNMDHDEKKESEVAEKRESDLEALKKCLEENKGDNAKCRSLVEAFKSSSTPKPVTPMRPISIRIGSWTDV